MTSMLTKEAPVELADLSSYSGTLPLAMPVSGGCQPPEHSGGSRPPLRGLTPPARRQGEPTLTRSAELPIITKVTASFRSGFRTPRIKEREPHESGTSQRV